MIKEAVDAARGADVVILVAGLDQVIEHEAFDRTKGRACDLRPGWRSPVLGLPGCQSDLVQAIHAVNPNSLSSPFDFHFLLLAIALLILFPFLYLYSRAYSAQWQSNLYSLGVTERPRYLGGTF